jgi:hypothetical protein
MDKEIRSRVRTSQTCALSKPAQNSRLGLLASEVAQRPMQNIFIDYVGKLPRSLCGRLFQVCLVDSRPTGYDQSDYKLFRRGYFLASLFQRFWYQIMPNVSHPRNSGNFVLN